MKKRSKRVINGGIYEQRLVNVLHDPPNDPNWTHTGVAGDWRDGAWRGWAASGGVLD